LKMLTEGATGGKCHNCGYTRCELRYGSEGYFQYESCPKCGFAYGNYMGDKELVDVWNEEIWTEIEYITKRTRKDIYELNKAVPEKDLVTFNGGSLWVFSKEALEKGLNNLKNSCMEVYN
jgi:hypothetical protein